ncbi:TPA: ead/Ea22-like family protein [Enterobacter ludwigii]|nr:ead/Ea22-like family protein [Enterobacter ludwigii]
MSNIDKQALREMAERAASDSWGYDRDEFNDAITPEVVLALLDELEAAEKKTVEMPTFDGYVPHVARELQAAFRIACDNAGINIAAAGKGEAS